MLNLVMNISRLTFNFENFEHCTTYYKNIINTLKQMNYTEFESEQFIKYENELNIMGGLGALVHPMRLTFVEFYKNANFTGGGTLYNPFKKNN